MDTAKLDAVTERMIETVLSPDASRSEQAAAAAALASLMDAQTRRMDLSARLAPPLAPLLTEAPALPEAPESKSWLAKIGEKLTEPAPAIAA